MPAHFRCSVYECVVKNGFGSLAITNRPDGFATKDLFLRNAEHPDQWKYCGRADDTLTQVSCLLFQSHRLYAR